MTLPQQDAVEEQRRRGAAHPHDVDLSREPYGGDVGIDPRLYSNVDRRTGEIRDRCPRAERHTYLPAAWPPRSGGPLPPKDRIPPDLNIGTATDEIDAWAHEHDAATTALEVARRERTNVQIEVMKARMKYRRIARANPKERGRRTDTDINAEVDEALASDPQYIRLQELETEIEIQTGRLFRAKDNQYRLDSYIKSLPRDGNYRP